ncbi:MAG: ribosome-associated translation inhibitor RaiA [Planctomycetota bacterium]|jgi:putative sigma-54 modulation protein|nr:ribosome-associated translation inhibitor RaiA [Planctomycetota bacterium]
MDIQITAKKIEIPQEIREYAKEKFGKIEKFHHKILSVEVIVKAEERRVFCETIVRLDHHGGSIVIEVGADTIQGAVDLAVDKCERQLRKEKERESVRRRQIAANKHEDRDM